VSISLSRLNYQNSPRNWTVLDGRWTVICELDGNLSRENQVHTNADLLNYGG